MLHREKCGKQMDKTIGDHISMVYNLFHSIQVDEANKVR